MNGFLFNKVYVIESLDDQLTGKELHDDLLRWKEYQIKDFKAEYIPVADRKDFFKIFETIKKECRIEGQYPILHLEMHGSKDTLGLVLKSGELITWQELYDDLVEINSIIGNNLFITMAVCHGAYIMELIKIDKPSPYWGFIGSFEEIKAFDLLIRYNEFYDEFLKHFNLDNAIERLHNANPSIPSTYRFINSETMFKKINKTYFMEKFSEKQIKVRLKDGLKTSNINIKDKELRNQFERQFKIKLLKTKKDYFENQKKTFFMLDQFPDNEKRFEVKFEELNEQ